MQQRGWVGVFFSSFMVDPPDELSQIDPDLAVTPDVTDPDHCAPGHSQEWPDSSHGILLAVLAEVPI